MENPLLVIIDRIDDWFIFEDTRLNPYYCAILLLEKLSTRLKIGLIYNRVDLITTVLNKKSVSALEALDAAILLLSSRSLVTIKDTNGLEGVLFITKPGQLLLADYKKEYKK